MNKSLLDTDILSEIARGINPAVLSRSKTYRRSFGYFTLSTVSVLEIVTGYQIKQQASRINDFLTSLSNDEILDFDQPAAELAGRIAGDLIRTGRNIGKADAMIAATALVHGLELVTGNIDHFERVRQLGYPLALSNWRI